MNARDTTLKRLRMRSMRRGIKEMDLILSAYADSRLVQLSANEIALYERMLSENDQELYSWVNGQTAPPAAFVTLIDDIRRHMAVHVAKSRPS